MEAKDWITMFSVIALILGWFINSELNRRNEIAKQRLGFRMKVLQSFLDVWAYIEKNQENLNNPGFFELLRETRVNFQLYGQLDEIAIYEEFINRINAGESAAASNQLNKLKVLVRNRIREELKLEINK